MATIRVYQGPDDLFLSITVAETGEKIEHVRSVDYSTGPDPFGEIVLTLNTGGGKHEVDLTIDVEVGMQEHQSPEETS